MEEETKPAYLDSEEHPRSHRCFVDLYIFTPAAHDEVAFFGEHRPGGIPSSSESPRHRIQATGSMNNNSVAHLLP
jgi:hypothetical protein